MSATPTSRPVLQFSLQGLLLFTATVAIAVALYRRLEHNDVQPLVHYCFMVFAVGPWFAYLAAECLPIRAPQLRTAAANMLLLALFIVTLKLAEAQFKGPIVIVVALAALLLWTPQYMIFFVWRMGD